MADDGGARRVGPRRRAETPTSGNDEESGGRDSPISPLSSSCQRPVHHSPSPTPTASTSRDGAAQKPPQGPSIALVRLQKRLNAKSPRRIHIPPGNPISAALPSPLEGRHGGSAGSSRTISPIGEDAGRHSPQSPRERQRRNTPSAEAKCPPPSPGKPREFVPSMRKSAADDITPTTPPAGPVFDINTNKKTSWTSIPDLDGSADADLGMAGNPWHNPQLHQVLDLLQVAVMSSRNGWRLSEDKDKRPGRIFHKHSGSSSSWYCGMVSNPEHVSEPFRTPLPDEYRGLVSRLIEAVPALERRIKMAEARAGRVTEERLHDLALYESAVDEWDRREAEYKREIRRLEVLLAHETMGGMETVALARSTSVVNRSDSRKFTGRMRMVGEKVRQSLGGRRPAVDDPKSPSEGPRTRKGAVGRKATTGPTLLNQPYLGDRRKIVDEKHDVRVSKSLLTQPKAPLPTPKYGRVRGSQDSAQSPAETMANLDELLGPSNPAPSDPNVQARIGYERPGKQLWKSSSTRLSPDSSESDSPDDSSSSDDEDTAQGMTNEHRGESEDGLQRAGTMTQAKYNSSMHAQQTRQLRRQLSETSQEKKRFSFEPGEDQIRLSPNLTPPDSFGSVNHPVNSMAASSSSTMGAMPKAAISAKPDASHVPGSGSGTAPSVHDGCSVAIPGDRRASAATIRVVSPPSARQEAAAVSSVGSGESSVDGVLPQPGASNCRDATNHGPEGRKKDVGELRGQLEIGGDYFGYYPSSSAVVSRVLAPENPRPVEDATTAPSTAATAVANGSTSIQTQSPPPKKPKKSKGGGNAKRSLPPPPPPHPQAQTPPTGASDGGNAGAGTGTGTATGTTTLISAAAAAAAAATRGFASASARAASGVLFSAASRQITPESEGGDTPRGGLAGKVP